MSVKSDKILIRFSQERINEIFFTTIKKEDGSEMRLEVNVPAEQIDDRISTLFAEIGIVEEIGSQIKNIQVGDIAILDYNLFNDERKLISDDEDGRTYIVDPVSRYHKEKKIAPATRNVPTNQLVWKKGEVEYQSQLYGIIRNGELIANDPFVFLNHLPEETEKSAGKVLYMEVPEVIERQVLAISEISREKYDVKIGDIVSIRTLDTFTVRLNDKNITCCNDQDLLIVREEA